MIVGSHDELESSKDRERSLGDVLNDGHNAVVTDVERVVVEYVEFVR
jgi:hypothetical protein